MAGSLPYFLVALLLVAHVPTGSGAQSEGDEWADIQGIGIGDFWKFRVTGQENGEIHNEVVAKEKKKNTFDKTWESYRIHAEGELKSRQKPKDPTGLNLNKQEAEVTITIKVDKWVRTDDYAIVQLEGETSVQSDSEPTTTDVTESYDPPLVETVFPFTEGYSWRTGAYHRLERGSEPAHPMKLEIVYEVLGIEEVTVPAGTFTAWKVQVTGGERPDTFKYQWYAEEACDLVKEERYKNEDRELVNTLQLLSYKCSRTEKANPTYDPDWVELVTTGGKVPPLKGFDKYDPPGGSSTNTASGIGFTTLLLLGVAALAATGSGLLVRHVRR